VEEEASAYRFSLLEEVTSGSLLVSEMERNHQRARTFIPHERRQVGAVQAGHICQRSLLLLGLVVLPTIFTGNDTNDQMNTVSKVAFQTGIFSASSNCNCPLLAGANTKCFQDKALPVRILAALDPTSSLFGRKRTQLPGSFMGRFHGRKLYCGVLFSAGGFYSLAVCMLPLDFVGVCVYR
jgi:hypothetical protein